MKKDNTKTTIILLAVLVLILAMLVIYAFVLRPAITGYAANMQNQGVNIILNSIVAQIQQQGYVQIPFGNETLILVPYQPTEQDNVVSLVG